MQCAYKVDWLNLWAWNLWASKFRERMQLYSPKFYPFFFFPLFSLQSKRRLVDWRWDDTFETWKIRKVIKCNEGISIPLELKKSGMILSLTNYEEKKKPFQISIWKDSHHALCELGIYLILYLFKFYFCQWNWKI